MQYLFDFLGKKAKVTELVKAFSFSDKVKLYNYGIKENEEYSLHIVVNQTGELDSYKIPQYLESKLQDMLQCEVTVLVDTRLKELYRKNIEENSALLADEESVKSLFAGKNITLKKKDELSNLQGLLLQQANTYLASKSPVTEKFFLGQAMLQTTEATKRDMSSSKEEHVMNELNKVVSSKMGRVI